MAINTGLECSHEELSDEVGRVMSLSRAVRRLSVEDRVDNRELRRRGVFGVAGRTPSATVEARLNILCRSCAGIWASPSAGALSIAEEQRLMAACSRQSDQEATLMRSGSTRLRRYNGRPRSIFVVLVTLTLRVAKSVACTGTPFGCCRGHYVTR
jgi:hypothetical protein